jgi:hypothetical protein
VAHDRSGVNALRAGERSMVDPLSLAGVALS